MSDDDIQDLATTYGVTAGELRQFLDLRFEANGALLEPTVRIAVNNELCFDTMAIVETDEIAFMPPVGGG